MSIIFQYRYLIFKEMCVQNEPKYEHFQLFDFLLGLALGLTPLNVANCC